MCTVEVHEDPAHSRSDHDRPSPREAAAARMRLAVTQQRPAVSQVTRASQATTLSLPSASSHIQDDSSCSTPSSSLWSSLRGGVGEISKLSSVDNVGSSSDLSTTTNPSSLWPNLKKIPVHLPREDLAQDSQSDILSSPSTATGVSSFSSLWPRIGEMVRSATPRDERRGGKPSN